MTVPADASRPDPGATDEALNPFVDERQHPALYGDARRLTHRTSALGAAKIAGAPVAEVIASLAPDAPHRVFDVGCGRGGTTRHLLAAWSPSRLIALDASAALLAEARIRVAEQAPSPLSAMGFVRADFHELPAPVGSVDMIVAAFCLYHAPEPSAVFAEFARVLAPGGRAIVVTKSADSYAALDDLLAASGADPQATVRPSLYESFHSANAEAVAARHLRVETVVHHQHRFRFGDADHVARYVATTPKYRFTDDVGLLPERLRAVIGEDGVTAESTVTYVTCRRA